MKINIIGGGPAGLYSAILMKQANASHDITIFERNGPDDTFGWGVVFSGKTLGNLCEADEPSHAAITRAFEAWDNVDVVHRDEKISIHGNSFSGIARIDLLKILQHRCEELGVALHFHQEVGNVEALRANCDLLVAADGVNSTVRQSFAETFQTDLSVGSNKYIWYGTNQLFHGLTLTFRASPTGVFAAHSYKFNKTTSTFIVECDAQTWQAAGFKTMSDEATRSYLAGVFHEDLGGHPLLSNNSKWINFVNVKNAHWSHGNVVLLGDALHTAHFSIGSGTKLALEDAIALKRCFDRCSDVATALDEFEQARKPIIEAYQAAACESRVWFENARRYMGLTPIELAFSLMTRSGRVDVEELRRRDPEFVAAYERSKNAKCFRAGTRVKTETGFKAIETIERGERVWTHRNRLRTVVGVQRRPHNGRVIGLQLKNCSFTVWVTPEQLFLRARSSSSEANSKSDEEVLSRQASVNSRLTVLTRKLRQEGTAAEGLLWECLRGRRLNGLKFRRQHPFGTNYILDFYCPQARLGIELDGSVHNSRGAGWADGIRYRQIQLEKVRVLRFQNKKVFSDLEGVLREIAECAFSRSSLQAFSPSPQAERGPGGEARTDEIPTPSPSPLAGRGNERTWVQARHLLSADEIVADELGKVLTIEKLDHLFLNEAVYDLTVQEDHSFVTEAGVVHQ